jgi:K+-sensing histidine kinase KdpD
VDAPNPDGAATRLGMASIEPATGRAFHTFVDSVVGSTALERTVRQVLRTGQPARLAQADEAWHTAHLPPVARGRSVGCLTLLRTGGPARAYTSAELGLAKQLAERAALALANAALRDANQAVRTRDEALRVRDDVLRFASHDLKNPLSSMRQHTEVLLDC